jgi:hypothetical protein
MKPSKQSSSLWQRLTTTAVSAGEEAKSPREGDPEMAASAHSDMNVNSSDNNEALVPPPSTTVTSPIIPQSLLEDVRFLSDLCTRLWRVDSRLRDMLENRQEDAELDRLGRRFEEIMETLRRNDYEIIDPVGQKYDPGLNLRVIQYESRDDLSEETIIETVRPTLRLKAVLVPGEVIVGTPVVEPQAEQQAGQSAPSAANPQVESAEESPNES